MEVLFRTRGRRKASNEKGASYAVVEAPTCVPCKVCASSLPGCDISCISMGATVDREDRRIYQRSADRKVTDLTLRVCLSSLDVAGGKIGSSELAGT